jgi:uncharacterized protein
MKQIESGKVDLIVTDPPYCISYKTGWRADGHRFSKEILNDDNEQLIIDYMSECYRILKDDSAAYIFCRAKTCGHAGVMEFNGDVYSCDHFVFPEYKLGNIHEKTLVEMMYSERQMKFGQMKQDSLPRQCKECEFLFACNGECPKNRFSRTADGEPGLNYLCKGYHQFFQHVAPYMDYMKKELLAERAPANIMEAIKKGEL